MKLACELATGNGGAIDFSAVPNAPGVFLVGLREGRPYIGKTAVLRQRLTRLLRPPERQSRLLNLSDTAARVAYQVTGSAFESMVLLYRLAKQHRPEDYQRFLKLRPPPMLKVNLANPYPRSYVTRRLGVDGALYFGPFTTRAAAERFQNAFLDLFLMRRCVEEIIPNPSHPGCVYGEMSMCLRPCQAAATQERYRDEVGHVVEFLSSRGHSLVKQLGEERDRVSTDLEFELAARLHRKLEKAREALAMVEDLARDVERLDGVIIQRSAEPAAVDLWFLRQGYLQPPARLSFAVQDGQPVSLDQKLKELIAGLEFAKCPARERSEYLAMLARWHGSSWRQGEIILFDEPERVPFRKIVRAISRVAAGAG